ncbi:MAG: hypothetical protein NTX61_09930 [Bacteroidetes bacterium]|nr:hypothetical protein [Bacteroidota bacterium]
MKRITLKILIFLVVTIIPAIITFADPPGPPSPGGTPVGGGGKPVGGPIEDGITILLALAIGYSIFKLIEIRKKAKSDMLKNPANNG